MNPAGLRVAIYARVSTLDQTCENQLLELRRYVEARGWSAVEYVDTGVSGSKDRRPALDQLTADIRRHRLQAVVCWRLDRLGRNLRHLVLMLDEWQAPGVAFVTLGEGIDTSTPAGRLVQACSRVSRSSSALASRSAFTPDSPGHGLKGNGSADAGRLLHVGSKVAWDCRTQRLPTASACLSRA
jgi:hypothetical protein